MALPGLAGLPGLEWLTEPWANDPPPTTRYPDSVERWRPDVETTMPAALRDRPDATQLVDKYLWAMQFESGGNPTAVHDGGAGYGIMADRVTRTPPGTPVEQQLANAWSLVQRDLTSGGTGFGDWGEGRTYDYGDGRGPVPFGAFGVHPYQGGTGLATQLSSAVSSFNGGQGGPSPTAALPPVETDSTTVARARLSAQQAREAAAMEQLRANLETTTGDLQPSLPHELQTRNSQGPDPTPPPQPGDLAYGQTAAGEAGAQPDYGTGYMDTTPNVPTDALSRHLSQGEPQTLTVNPDTQAGQTTLQEQQMVQDTYNQPLPDTGALERNIQQRLRDALTSNDIVSRGISAASDLATTPIKPLARVRTAATNLAAPLLEPSTYSTGLSNPIGGTQQLTPEQRKVGGQVTAGVLNPIPSTPLDIAIAALPAKAALRNAAEAAGGSRLGVATEEALSATRQGGRFGPRLQPYQDTGGAIVDEAGNVVREAAPREPLLQQRGATGEPPTIQTERPSTNITTGPVAVTGTRGGAETVISAQPEPRPQDVTKPVADVPVPPKLTNPASVKAVNIPQEQLDAMVLEPPEKPAQPGGIDQPEDIAKKVVIVHNDPRLEAVASPRSGKAMVVGNMIVGGLPTTEQWVQVTEASAPSAEQIMKDAACYKEVPPGLIAAFEAADPAEQERIIRAYAYGNRRTSSERAAGDVLRIQDRITGQPREGAGTMNAEIIRPALEGKQITGGVGPKLSDFEDILQGKTATRSWARDDPRAEGPFVADTHTSRDAGYIDPEMARYIEKQTGKTVEQLGLKMDNPSASFNPTEVEYELVSRWGNQLTRELNARDGGKGWLGKTDWQPNEIQAIGWARVRRELGLADSEIGSILQANSRQVAAAIGPEHPLAVQHGWGDLPAGQRAKAVTSYLEQAMAHMRQTMPLARVKDMHIDEMGQVSVNVFASPETAKDVAAYLAHVTGGGSAIAWRPLASGKTNVHAVDLEGLSPAETKRLAEELQPLARQIAITDNGQRLWLLGTTMNDAQMQTAVSKAGESAKIEGGKATVNNRQKADITEVEGTYGSATQPPTSGHLAAAVAGATEHAPGWAQTATESAKQPLAPAASASVGAPEAGVTPTGAAPDYGEARQLENGLRSRFKPTYDGPVDVILRSGDTRIHLRRLSSEVDSQLYEVIIERSGASMAEERNPEGADTKALLGLRSIVTDLVESNPDAVFLNHPVGGLEGRRARIYEAAGFRTLDERAASDLVINHNLQGGDAREILAQGRYQLGQYLDRAAWRTDQALPRQLPYVEAPGGAGIARSPKPTAAEVAPAGQPSTNQATVGPFSNISYTGTPGKPTSGPKAKELDAHVESGDITPQIAENLKRRGLTWGDWQAMNNSFANATPEYVLNQNPNTLSTVTSENPPPGGWPLPVLKEKLAQALHLAESPSASVDDMRAALQNAATVLRGNQTGTGGWTVSVGGGEPQPLPEGNLTPEQLHERAQQALARRGRARVPFTTVAEANAAAAQTNATTESTAVTGTTGGGAEQPNYGPEGLITSLPSSGQPQLPGMPPVPEPGMTPEQEAELAAMQTEFDNWRAQSNRNGFPPDWSRERIINYMHLVDAAGPPGGAVPPGSLPPAGPSGPDGQLPGMPDVPREFSLLQEFGAILGLPQTLLSSFDASGTIRPGLRAGATDFAAYKEAIRRQLKALTNEAYAQLTQKAIQSNTWYENSQELGKLHMFGWGPGIADAERVPGFTGLNQSRVAHYLETSPLTTPIRASERARAIMLNWLGMDIYAKMATAMSKTEAFQALSNAEREKWFRELGRGINIARGYGSFNIGQVLPGFNAMFSGRNLVSLAESPFQVLRAPGSIFEPSPRQYAAKAMANLTGTYLALMGFLGITGALAGGLWSVNANPTSGDWGQLRVGNTRFDIMAGYGPIIKTIARASMAATGHGRPGESVGADLVSFFRNKASPLTSLAINMISGSDTLGNAFKLTPQVVAAMFVPLIAQSVAEAVVNNQGLEKALAIPAAVGEFFGAGTNTYQTAEDLRGQYARRMFSGRGYTELDYGEQRAVRQAIEDAGLAPPKSGVAKAADEAKAGFDAEVAGYEKAWKEGTLTTEKLTDRWGDVNKERLGSAKLQAAFYDDAGITPGSDLAKRFSGLMDKYKGLADAKDVTDENGQVDFQLLRKRQQDFVAGLSDAKQGSAVSDRQLMQSYLDYTKSQKTTLQQQYEDYLTRKDQLGYEHIAPDDKEDVKQQKTAKNKALDFAHPEIDAQAWLFGSGQKGVAGGTLASKPAVDLVLQNIDRLGLGDRTVHFGSSDRNLNTPEGRKLWAAEGATIAKAFDDPTLISKNRNYLEAVARQKFGVNATFDKLTPPQKSELMSQLRDDLFSNDPKLSALHAYLGFGGNTATKTYTLHGQAAYVELQRLKQLYGDAPAKEGWKYIVQAR